MDEGGGKPHGGRRGRPSVSSSQKKRKAWARQRKYRAKISTISISEGTAQQLRAIGEENGISRNQDVIALLISTYRQQQLSGPGLAGDAQNENPQTSTPICTGVSGTPSSAESLPFFDSPFVPRIECFSSYDNSSLIGSKLNSSTKYLSQYIKYVQCEYEK